MQIILLLREVASMLFLPILVLIFVQRLESKGLGPTEANCIRLGIILGTILSGGIYLLTRGG